MAQAQLIQGTGEELLPHLERHRHQKNLLLIIPEEAAEEVIRPAGQTVSEISGKTVVRNGVPLFPTQGAAQPVTLELVKHLAEEE